MKLSLKSLLKTVQKESVEYSIVALLIAFIVFGDVPREVASLVRNQLVQLGMYAFALSILLVHPILGLVSIIAVYEVIRMSKEESRDGRKYVPDSVAHVELPLGPYNQFPVTLEEQVVATTKPYVSDVLMSGPSYVSKSQSTHGASNL
jgi:hypothetical protein